MLLDIFYYPLPERTLYRGQDSHLALERKPGGGRAHPHGRDQILDGRTGRLLQIGDGNVLFFQREAHQFEPGNPAQQGISDFAASALLRVDYDDIRVQSLDLTQRVLAVFAQPRHLKVRLGLEQTADALSKERMAGNNVDANGVQGQFSQAEQAGPDGWDLPTARFILPERLGQRPWFILAVGLTS